MNIQNTPLGQHPNAPSITPLLSDSPAAYAHPNRNPDGIVLHLTLAKCNDGYATSRNSEGVDTGYGLDAFMVHNVPCTD